MKKLILFAIAFILVPTIALADYFQVFDGSGPYYVPYARVTLDGKTIGYTDAYGRISVELPRGEYHCTISHRDQRKRIRLRVNGEAGLKRVNAS